MESPRPLVGRLGLGTRSLGGPAVVDGAPVGGAAVPEPEAVLREAWELGIRHFDTCDAYGLGHAERLIGRFREELGDEADQLRLSARLGLFRGTASHPLRAVHMRHQLEQLAENTGVDELDLLSVTGLGIVAGHDDGVAEETVEAMRSFRETGWARRIGVTVPASGGRDLTSPHNRWFQRLVKELRPDVLHVGIADLSPGATVSGESLLELASRLDAEIVVHGPLLHGLLAGTYPASAEVEFRDGDLRSAHPWFTPAARRSVDRHLEILRERFGSEPAHLIRLALRYCLQTDTRIAVFLGATSALQVREALEAAALPLSDTELPLVRQVFAAMCTDLDRLAQPL